MSQHTHFHAPRKTLSWRIKIGHKGGFILFIIYSVNIKPPWLRFGFSLCLGLAILIKYWQSIKTIQARHPGHRTKIRRGADGLGRNFLQYGQRDYTIFEEKSRSMKC
jgi:hypothetical protein